MRVDLVVVGQPSREQFGANVPYGRGLQPVASHSTSARTAARSGARSCRVERRISPVGPEVQLSDASRSVTPGIAPSPDALLAY